MDKITIVSTLINTSYLTYSIILSKFVRQYNLKHIVIKQRLIIRIYGTSTQIYIVIQIRLNIKGYEEEIQVYKLDRDNEYNLILGRLQINQHRVTVALVKKSIFIYSLKVQIRSREGKRLVTLPIYISTAAYAALTQRLKTDTNIQVYAALIADIQKVLKKKNYADPRTKLSRYL